MIKFWRGKGVNCVDYYDTLHQLASIWLEQQDLSGKSPADISDMYFIALQEIHQVYNEKYKPKEQPQ